MSRPGRYAISHRSVRSTHTCPPAGNGGDGRPVSGFTKRSVTCSSLGSDRGTIAPVPVTLTIAHATPAGVPRGQGADRITKTADTYDEALEQAKAEMPEGHILYSISRYGDD